MFYSKDKISSSEVDSIKVVIGRISLEKERVLSRRDILMKRASLDGQFSRELREKLILCSGDYVNLSKLYADNLGQLFQACYAIDPKLGILVSICVAEVSERASIVAEEAGIKYLQGLYSKEDFDIVRIKSSILNKIFAVTHAKEREDSSISE